jgi:putative ATP-dependent endonuclease of OLD family
MSEVFLVPGLVKKVMGTDLEEKGVSVVPIYGVHFDAYLKLFADKGIRKKCAVLTDGDLHPSDAKDTDFEFPRVSDLKTYENDFIKVFNCKTTFEQAIAMPGNFKLFSQAAAEIGATTISTDLLDFYERRTDLTFAEKEDARQKVLNTAKRFGKARFAQIASKYAEEAEAVPEYIEKAVEWVIG